MNRARPQVRARTRASSARSGVGSAVAVRPLPQEGAGPRLQLLLRRRVSARAVASWGAAFFFVVLAGSVTIQAQRIETQHKTDRVESELVHAGEQHRRLRAEVAVAESPQQIIDAARAIGMVDPGAVVPLVPSPILDPADTPPTGPADTPPTGPAGPQPIDVPTSSASPEVVASGTTPP